MNKEITIENNSSKPNAYKIPINNKKLNLNFVFNDN